MQAGKRTTLRVSLHMLFSSFSFDNFLSFFFEVCFCLVFPARLLFVPVHVVKRKGRLKPTTTARNPLRELSGCKKKPSAGSGLASISFSRAMICAGRRSQDRLVDLCFQRRWIV